jgi:hypothetical protein
MDYLNSSLSPHNGFEIAYTFTKSLMRAAPDAALVLCSELVEDWDATGAAAVEEFGVLLVQICSSCRAFLGRQFITSNGVHFSWFMRWILKSSRYQSYGTEFERDKTSINETFCTNNYLIIRA